MFFKYFLEQKILYIKNKIIMKNIKINVLINFTLIILFFFKFFNIRKRKSHLEIYIMKKKGYYHNY